ncbi:AAA family ATPase [Raineyella fluvialis]|uniref:AAA family ATPase n=1 Tax=Raineyella fluvialis TaxID=2662261 RepID=A0A5Q2F6P0_9ACTN|nr:AAA family ATPase [Raineyella fluvialis]QGF22652.1 AAA family ATPase [Raineyella fluvialis]
MPTLLFVVGPAGSGKSTCAKSIARRLRAAYVDKDTVATGFTEALLVQAGTDPHERDNNAYYQDHVMDLEYETILRIATDNLLLGMSVVLDAPFGRYLGDDHYVIGAAERLGWPEDVRLVVAHVRVDGEVIRQRLVGRGLERDAWKVGHWGEFWSTAGDVVCTWRGAEHLSVDNNGDEPDLDRFEAELHR